MHARAVHRGGPALRRVSLLHGTHHLRLLGGGVVELHVFAVIALTPRLRVVLLEVVLELQLHLLRVVDYGGRLHVAGLTVEDVHAILRVDRLRVVSEEGLENEEQDQHNEHDVEPRALPERPGGVVVPVGAAVVARLVGIVAEWVKRVRPVVAAA